MHYVLGHDNDECVDNSMFPHVLSQLFQQPLREQRQVPRVSPAHQEGVLPDQTRGQRRCQVQR